MSWSAKLAAALVALSAGAEASLIWIPVTADTSMSAYPDERSFTAGAAPRIKLKGIENMILIDFDPRPIWGKRVKRAYLRITGTDNRLMVRRVGVSGIATGWLEGASAEYAPGEGACFLRPGTGRNAWWAGTESNFLDAIFGRGGTLWTREVAEHDGAGRYSIPIDPRILEARAARLSCGIVLSDDSGQTMNGSKEVVPETNLSNNFFYSREQSNHPPVLDVEIDDAPVEEPADPAPVRVAVAPWGEGASNVGGGIEISWAGPASATEAEEVLGYRIWLTIDNGKTLDLPRWMHPAVPPPGEHARALIRNLPAGRTVVAEVDVFGRGGVIVAHGEGGGFASAALDYPNSIVVPEVAANQPASVAAVSPVWVIPDGTKVNPVTGNALEEPGIDYAGAPAGSWRDANPAWDGAARTVRLAGIRGEWVAFQIVVEHRGAGAGIWKVVPGALSGPAGGVIPAAAVRLSRLKYIRIGNAWYADPMVPLKSGDSVRVPADDHAFPDQTNQAVYAELHIPESARPGAYKGSIEVRPGNGPPVAITVAVDVAPAVMPREAHFTWSMNAYSTPGPKAERAYYALAHDHRTNLAILHYSHSGNYEPGCVPRVKGRGASARVADWTEWDARFGPLFDGTAFANTSRPGIGLDHFYLALCEHYPVPMSEGYKWNDVRWEDHWKVAGTVEEGFSRRMQETWVAVAKDYIAHIKARGWKTTFQVYLNDKYYYKQYDAKRKAWGRGVSFWLLDEPLHTDDFLALGFFGNLLREAQAGDRSRVIFRADVSSPQWGRDILDRVVDLNDTGGWPEYRRLLEDWKARWGQKYWTYGDTPPATQSALALSAQAMNLWANGVDGYVPWLVLGEDRNWMDFASTSVIYPGKPAGVDGPCASLRLKAYRRAEQDVEYVWLYANKRGWLKDDPFRRRVAALLSEALKFTRTFGFLDSEGARTELIEGVTPAALESLRSALRAGL
jgi:hypothetical protein